MSSRLIDAIPNDNHSAFLAELLEAYVDRPGLGAMPKADLDALIVHLYRKYCGTPDHFDVFDLSQRFRLRETRVKTLVSLGELKFGTMVEGDAWCTVLASTAKSRFAVESLERGQIRFPLENPALYPYLNDAFGSAAPPRRTVLVPRSSRSNSKSFCWCWTASGQPAKANSAPTNTWIGFKRTSNGRSRDWEFHSAKNA